MPSKLEHEFVKIRGETKETGQVYTDSIATLKDSLTEAEDDIKSLESDKVDNISKIKSLKSLASRALMLAKNSVKKSGDIILGSLKIDDIDIGDHQISLHESKSDTVSLYLNYKGYKGGATKFRNCLIGNGKSAAIANFTGSTKQTSLEGLLVVDTINNKSAATGVTVETVLIKDGDVDGRDISVDGTKLDTIDTDATKYPNTGEQAFLDADHTKLNALVNLTTGILNLGSAPRTILDGSDTIAITRSFISIDTNGGASWDDLDTITGGTVGDVLIMKQYNAARDVTIKHAVGNIRCNGGTDTVFNDLNDMVVLVYNGSNWIEIAQSLN